MGEVAPDGRFFGDNNPVAAVSGRYGTGDVIPATKSIHRRVRMSLSKTDSSYSADGHSHVPSRGRAESFWYGPPPSSHTNSMRPGHHDNRTVGESGREVRAPKWGRDVRDPRPTNCPNVKSRARPGVRVLRNTAPRDSQRIPRVTAIPPPGRSIRRDRQERGEHTNRDSIIVYAARPSRCPNPPNRPFFKDFIGGWGKGSPHFRFSVRNMAIFPFEPPPPPTAENAKIDGFYDFPLQTKAPISPGSIMGRDPVLLPRCHF